MTPVRADRTARALGAAGAVADPELPGLTLADLGILRRVEQHRDVLVITLAPTYSGCPALREILRDVHSAVSQADVGAFEVRLSLDPPWTSDWITADGRRKLAEVGIAPPQPAPRRVGPVPLTLTGPTRRVGCPSCGSAATTERSRFGATACRALYRCENCGEPFEYFKEI